MKQTSLKIILMLVGLLMGNEKMAAQEPEEKAVWSEPFELVFRDCGGNSDKNSSYNLGSTSATPTKILTQGACYISSFNVLTNIYQAKKDFGIKIGKSQDIGMLEFELAKDIKIKKIELVCKGYNGNEYPITVNNGTQNIPSANFTTLEYTHNLSKKINISVNKGEVCYIKSIKIYPEVATVEIKQAKFRTYIPKSGLDFTDTDVNAYAISNTAPNEGIVYLTKISKYNATSGIEKHNAIIINGSPGNHNINIIASKPEIKNPDNCMYYSPEEIDISKDGENYYYILALIDDQVGFAAVTEGTIPVERGYFTLPRSANIKEFKFAIDNEETSIDIPKVDNGHNSQSLNLSGQRVGDNYKGIIIRNGKKYLKR